MSTRDLPARIGDLPAIGRPATGALLSIDVTTLEQVSRLTRAELLAMHGIGPKAIRILADALAADGRSFAASASAASAGASEVDA